jgi:hypothetical protein
LSMRVIGYDATILSSLANALSIVPHHDGRDVF